LGGKNREEGDPRKKKKKKTGEPQLSVASYRVFTREQEKKKRGEAEKNEPQLRKPSGGDQEDGG